MNHWKASLSLIEAYNHSTPLYIPNAITTPQLGFHQIQEWLNFSHAPENSAFILENENKKTLPVRFFKSKLQGGNQILSRVKVESIIQELGKKSSLVIKNFESLHPSAFDLVLKIGVALQAVPHANLYYTPAGTQTFKKHSDPHSLVIIQIEGSKKWTVENLEDDILLSPGDILFIPKNTLHEAQAVESSSHLSIGLYPVEIIDILSEFPQTKRHLPLSSQGVTNFNETLGLLKTVISDLSLMSVEKLEEAIRSSLVSKMKHEWIPSLSYNDLPYGELYVLNERMFFFILFSKENLTIISEKIRLEFEGDSDEILALMSESSRIEHWKDREEVLEQLLKWNILCRKR